VSGAPVHARLAELMAYVDAQRAEVLAAVDALPVDACERRPSPERWSAAEQLEHLWLVETGSAKLLHTLLKGVATRGGLPAETSDASVLGALDRFGLVRGSKPLAAPEMVTPSHGLTCAQARTALETSRGILRAFVAKGAGLDLTLLRAPHPRLGELTGYEWILFIGQHEARHAQQLRALAVPGGGSHGDA